MNRSTWFAAIVIALAPLPGFAQMGGMGGGMGGMGGQGMRAGMMTGSRMAAAGPTEVRRTAQVEMEGGHRLTGRIDLRPLTVQTELGHYAILPDKVKMIRFLKPANDDRARDVADERPGAAAQPMGMMRAQMRAQMAMMGDANGVMQAAKLHAKVVTTSDQEIIGDIYIPPNFKLEFEFGSLTLAPSKLRSITFVAPDRKAGPTKVEAAATRAPGEAPDAAPAPPRYFRHDHSIIVASPAGERVALHNLATGRSQSLALSGSKDAPIEVTPMLGADLVALALEGPRITRIAVADLAGGSWHPQDLREPAEGPVRPVVAGGLAVYSLGRYVYAYSAEAHRWDVADLPEDLRGRAVVGPEGATAEGNGHIYTFLLKTGRWEHIDVRAVLDGAGSKKKG